MSLVILHASRLPVIRIMRIAGQYAKPRSKPTEVVELQTANGKESKEVLSFRGDNVNGYDVTERMPDPERLLGCEAVYSSRLTSGLTSTQRPRSTTSAHSYSPVSQTCINPWTGHSPTFGHQNSKRRSLPSLTACKTV